MAGTPLDQMAMLLASQGPAWATGPDTIVNDVARRTYTGNRIVANGNMIDMIQGGDEITDTIFLNEGSTFTRYNPNESFSYDMPQTGTTWTVPWAFATAHLSVTKQELGLNVESMGRRYRTQMYKRVMYQKHQNLWTDVCNSIESEYWCRPDRVNMEDAAVSDKRKPYPINVFINEFASGLPPAIVDIGGNAWTTVQRIQPTLVGNEKWRCFQARYNSGGYSWDQTNDTLPNCNGYTFSSASALGMAGIFPTFSKAYWGMRFDRLPKKPEYSDKTTSPQVIWCSVQGITNYEAALRSNQDEFRGVGKTSGQDPAYDGPTFRNTPLEVIDILDNALLYSDDTECCDENGVEADGGTATSTFLTGPRYYWVNTLYLNFVVHQDNYCVLGEPFSPSDRPFTKIQVMDLWNNTVARSLRRHGIVSPAEDTTNA